MKSVFLIVSFLCSVVIFGQEKGTISGEILDAGLSNEPLLFAHATLQGSGQKTRTNLWGRFKFTDIEPGSYVLHIAFAGYESLDLPVTITSGQTTSIMEHLIPKDLVGVMENPNTKDLSKETAIVSGSK